MATLSGIARPYALAAFDYANEHHALAAWKAFLEAGATVAKDPAVLKLLLDPSVSSEKIQQLFEAVLDSLLDTERKNFLRLLSQYERLIALPDIAEGFNAYCAALEKTSDVRIVTAIALSDDFRQRLSQVLTKRIQRDVTLQCEVNPAVLGGAVIHIGDHVIDGSVRGKLLRLLQNLTG